MNPLNAPVDLYGVWRMSIFFGLIGCLFIWMKPKKFDFPTALTVYVLSYCVYISEFPNLSFGEWHTAFQASAGQTFIEVSLVILGVLTAPKWVMKLIPWLAAVETILVLGNGYGLMVAPSFDTALIALCTPFLPFWLSAAGIAVIITHHGSTALLILGAQLLAYLFKNRRDWVLGAVSVPLLLAIGYSHHHGAFFDGGERILAWKRFMTFWASDWHFITFGVGPGSFMWCSLLIDQFKAPMFLQMHSDWLQILFEYGVIGFFLAVGTMVGAIRLAWNDRKILPALFGVCAFGLSYHPLRFFPSAFMIMLTIKEAFLSCKES